MGCDIFLNGIVLNILIFSKNNSGKVDLSAASQYIYANKVLKIGLEIV